MSNQQKRHKIAAPFHLCLSQVGSAYDGDGGNSCSPRRRIFIDQSSTTRPLKPLFPPEALNAWSGRDSVRYLLPRSALSVLTFYLSLRLFPVS